MGEQLTETVKTNRIDGQFKKTAVLLFFCSVFSILFIAIIKKMGFVDLVKDLVLILIVNLILTCYITLSRQRILVLAHSWWMISVAYVISVICLFIKQPESGIPYWIVGGVLISGIVDLNLGMVLTYSLTVFSATVFGVTSEQLVYQLILSTLMCILASTLKKISSIVYAVIITVTMSITLLLVFQKFHIKQVFTFSGIITVFYLVAILIVVFILRKISIKWEEIEKETVQMVSIAELPIAEIPSVNTIDETNCGIKTESVNIIEKIKEAEEIKASEEAEEINMENVAIDHIDEMEALIETVKIADKLVEVAGPEFELIKRMEQESPKLYQHSKKIAELSRDAAKSVGADELTAYAGGWYHEIGKLVSKEYVEEGIRLAEEYELPECVVKIIRQHNLKAELPDSAEAVIVMFTDSILNMVNYLKKAGAHVDIEQIVGNAFQLRLNKGDLDKSGLGISDFHLLKQFYLENINTEH